jgi:DNA-binding MarR family transcriptional regulator
LPRSSARAALAAAPARTDAALDELIRGAEFRARLRNFEYESDRVAAEHGLTPRRYLLLLMIKGAPDGSERSTISELTERLRLEQHTVSELVARAEQAGLIERERSSDDRRVAYIGLTEEGEKRLLDSFRGLDADRRALRKLMA